MAEDDFKKKQKKKKKKYLCIVSEFLDTSFWKLLKTEALTEYAVGGCLLQKLSFKKILGCMIPSVSHNDCHVGNWLVDRIDVSLLKKKYQELMAQKEEMQKKKEEEEESTGAERRRRRKRSGIVLCRVRNTWNVFLY